MILVKRIPSCELQTESSSPLSPLITAAVQDGCAFKEKVMYKRILVAIDGSQAAKLALEEALKIAQAAQATVTAVFVAEHAAQMVDIGTGLVDEQTRGTAATEAALATLEDARALFEQRNVRGLTRSIDAYGEDIVTVLCRVAEECEADLVVMGTHGRHGIGRMLLGSVAEAFLRRAGMPVLLVRRERDMDEIPSSL
ncbi:MAG TPA: universal stress protein [Paraburkholderia sp.]|nr:universal stress protein [Paraburkholderia sp.]